MTRSDNSFSAAEQSRNSSLDLRGPHGPDYRGRLLGGRYALQRIIGAGGTATVYSALDRKLRRRVAVKVIHPEHVRTENQRRRIRQEATLGARVNHHNVMPVLDFGEGLLEGNEYVLFVVMPLVRGASLRTLILDGATPWPRAIELTRQLLAGLAALHTSGVLHRDIKPDNCFVTRTGTRDHLRVLDLGLAKSIGQHATITPPVSVSGATMGTVGYVSPEQARGQQLDERSDLYSTGVVLFELLTLQKPFTGSHYELLHAHVEHPAPRVRDLAGARLPELLDTIVFKSMAKQPEQRYASAEAFSNALLAVLQNISDEQHASIAWSTAALEGCDAAKASLAAWTSFEYSVALEDATRAARLDSAWSPLRLMMSCLPDDPL